MNDQTFEPAGVRFCDLATGKEMMLVTEGPWDGWPAYKHPDGQWISYREASPVEKEVILFCFSE